MTSPSPERAKSRSEYLSAGTTALREYERTGLAFAIKDVERYILAIAAGKKGKRPRPVKGPGPKDQSPDRA